MEMECRFRSSRLTALINDAHRHLFMAHMGDPDVVATPSHVFLEAENGWMVPYKRVLRWKASYFPSSSARMVIGGVGCSIILALYFPPDGTSCRGPLEWPPRRIRF
jgi:hypothetical protein